MGQRPPRRQFSADLNPRVITESYAFLEQSLPSALDSPTCKDRQRVDQPPMPSDFGIRSARDVRLVVKGRYEPVALGKLGRSITAAS